MVTVLGKNYEMIEMSAREYDNALNILEKNLGAEWQKARSISIGVILLTYCLKNQEDGSAPTAEEIWEWPVKSVITLTNKAMLLNGFTEETQASLEKN